MLPLAGEIRYNRRVSASNPFLSPKTVLITGASSGIGLELADLFASDGYRLVLVARNRAALRQLGDQLQSRYGVEVRISPKDLAHPAAPIELYQELQEANIVLDVLVNNAGFGGSGAFLQTDWNNESEMIHVNIVALTHLSKLFLPQIRAREGKLLNVASVAAFAAGPYMAIYYASKAFVLHFSEALAEELSGTGTTVTCLCPGPVITNFQQRAHLGESHTKSPLLVDVREVARAGYEGMKQGKRLVIPGWKNRLLTEGLRLTPRSLVTKVISRMHESKKSH
ncbi:MAG: SDR family NAD(P)-dependent oxidoreductase [Candidatus Korobacteraceae bacterium]